MAASSAISSYIKATIQASPVNANDLFNSLLVINADGTVSKASLEQQRIAIAARAAGADGVREQGNPRN